MITIIMCILIVLLVIVFYDPTPAFRAVRLRWWGCSCAQSRSINSLLVSNAEYFANELTVRHNRGERLLRSSGSRSTSRSWYQGPWNRGPRRAAGVVGCRSSARRRRQQRLQARQRV